MSETLLSQPDRNFRLLTPKAAFEAFCERERRRLEAMDTAFNADLFAQARSLVLARLGSEENQS